MRERMRVLLAVSAAGALIGGLGVAGTAGAVDRAPDRSADGTGAARSSGVPDKFKSESMSWITADRGYVVGWLPCAGDGERPSCMAMLTTSNGGETWEEFPAPDIFASGGWDRFSVVQAAETDGASTVMVNYNSDLWVTHDEGQTWQEAADNEFTGKNGAEPLLMTATSRYAYVTVYTSVPDQTQGYRTPIGEDQWEPVPELLFPKDYTGGADDFHAVGDNAIFVTDSLEQGNVIRVTEDGETWTERESPCGHRESNYQGAVASDRLYVVCSDWDTYEHRLEVSYDGGATFEPAGSVSGYWFDGFEDTLVSEGTDGCSAEVSSDGGSTWRNAWEISHPPTLKTEEVDVVDANTATVLCTGDQLWGPSGDIVRSTDGGQTWNDLGLNDG